VDKNPFAMNLAKLSLWLVTLSKDAPFTFLDHALKCGDSLVGLSRKQILNFGRDPIQDLPLMKYGQEQVLAAKVLRSQIQSGDTKSDADAAMKGQQLREAEAKLLQVRMQGDVAIAAFFDGCGKSKKDRENLNLEYGAVVRQEPERMMAIADRLRDREKPIVPFNWEVEFPEVFDRENGGFDAIVGNPPFMAGMRISSHYSTEYLHFLYELYPGSGNRADLVSYFFRKAFSLTRKTGSFGLIATNTISEGDTRKASLMYIKKHGGEIYSATRRLKWPGMASVLVSVIHCCKECETNTFYLDGQSVKKVSSYLIESSFEDEPHKQIFNEKKVFSGVYVYGNGFMFDDKNPESTSVDCMKSILKAKPEYQDFILPYVGGEEVLNNPNHSHHRYVIDLGQMSEEEAWKYPELMSILEAKVKPSRLEVKRDKYRKYWWQFAEPQRALRDALRSFSKVLMHPTPSANLAFTFIPSTTIVGQPHTVVLLEGYSAFCVLQSRTHEIWARFSGSSMKDDLRYTPSDCFETFPFPENWETNATLEAAGETYYTYRAQLMVTHNQGLTTTYNRFHEPEETDPAILRLRDLHTAMDKAVLTAYGWPDLDTTCEFILDYEDEEDTTSKRKKPYRYRWPQATHDEVLARLLDLNQKRYDEEIVVGKKEEGSKKKERKKGAGGKGRSAKAASPTTGKQIELIPPDTEQLNLL
jgi:hypothetical protein